MSHAPAAGTLRDDGWKCLNNSEVTTPVKLLPSGKVQCAASDGANCWWGQCSMGALDRPTAGLNPATSDLLPYDPKSWMGQALHGLTIGEFFKCMAGTVSERQ
jgi:hypothetical protein